MTPLLLIFICLSLGLAGTTVYFYQQMLKHKTVSQQLKKSKRKRTATLISEKSKPINRPIQPSIPFEHILNVIHAGILISSRDGKVVWFNRDAAELLDLNPGQLIGQPLSHILSHLPTLRTNQNNQMGNTSIDFELNGRKVQGGMHILYGSDGLDQGAVAVLNDVTAWHTTVQIQQEKLDAINHELKERLNYMESTTKFLQNSTDGPQKAWLPQLHENVGRVTKLIETLVQTAHIESDETLATFTPAFLNGIVQEALDELKPEIQKRQIYIKTDIDPKMRPIMCQPEHIKTIILELVTNGFRFNRPGGMVQIVGKLQNESEEAFLVLNVSDDGQGIPIDDQQKIFDVFYRPNAHQHGTQRNIGVGLAIVHAIVHAYHGRIWFKSQPDQGTLFTILLPAGDLTQDRPDETDEFDWITETLVP